MVSGSVARMTAAAKKDGWLQSRKDGFYGYVRLISKVTNRLAPEELLRETSAVVQHRVQSHCLLSMLPGKRTCLVCLKRRLVASFSYLLLLRSQLKNRVTQMANALTISMMMMLLLMKNRMELNWGDNLMACFCLGHKWRILIYVHYIYCFSMGCLTLTLAMLTVVVMI